MEDRTQAFLSTALDLTYSARNLLVRPRHYKEGDSAAPTAGHLDTVLTHMSLGYQLHCSAHPWHLRDVSKPQKTLSPEQAA